jgi:hypothetical protein
MADPTDEIPPPEDLFATLGDSSGSVDARREALRMLFTLAFDEEGFAAHRADFVQTLRALTGDADAELQRAAFSTLVRDGDTFAENLLIQGVQDPSLSVVPPSVALEFLRLAPHAATATLARDVLANSADPEERTQAAYLLAADPTAGSLLASLMTDQAEIAAVRQAAAISLRNVDSTALTNAARMIVANASDNWQVRAMSRTLLSLLVPEEADGDWIA